MRENHVVQTVKCIVQTNAHLGIQPFPEPPRSAAVSRKPIVPHLVEQPLGKRWREIGMEDGLAVGSGYELNLACRLLVHNSSNDSPGRTENKWRVQEKHLMEAFWIVFNHHRNTLCTTKITILKCEPVKINDPNPLL